MNMRVLNIYYHSNNAWAYMLGTSITSLLEHASTSIEYRIYIVSADMADETKEKFQSLHEKYRHINFIIEFIDANPIEKRLEQMGLPRHRSLYVTYYKLFVQTLFEGKDVDRLMIIGPDTLIMGDLHELLDFDFHGNPIAMNWSEHIYQRRFKRSYKYCIAEMVYIDMKTWTEKNCEERILNRLMKYGDIYGSKDEGMLNMEFQHEMAQLPLKFNLYGITMNFTWANKVRFNNAPIMTKEEIKKSYEDPQIIHIPETFLYRPYEENSKHPLYDIWWEYCRKSPWYDLQHQPEPVMGAKEKFLRFVYLHTSKPVAERLFIVARQTYSFMLTVLYPYKETYSSNVKQIHTDFEERKMKKE